jgi:hypothetical protein
LIGELENILYKDVKILPKKPICVIFFLVFAIFLLLDCLCNIFVDFVFQRRGVLWLKEYHFGGVEDKGLCRIEK